MWSLRLCLVYTHTASGTNTHKWDRADGIEKPVQLHRIISHPHIYKQQTALENGVNAKFATKRRT